MVDNEEIYSIKFANCRYEGERVRCKLYRELQYYYGNPDIEILARNVYVDEGIGVALNREGIGIGVSWTRHDNDSMNVRVGNHVDGGKIINFSADWLDKEIMDEREKEEKEKDDEIDAEQERLHREYLEMGIDEYGDEVPNWTSGESERNEYGYPRGSF